MTRTFQRNWLRLRRQHKHGTCYFMRYKSVLKKSNVQYALIVSGKWVKNFSRYSRARERAEDFLTPYNSVSIFRIEGMCAPIRVFYWIY